MDRDDRNIINNDAVNPYTHNNTNYYNNMAGGTYVQPGEHEYYAQNNNVNGMEAWYTSRRMEQEQQTTEAAANISNNNVQGQAAFDGSDVPKRKKTKDKNDKKPGFGIKLLQTAAVALLFGLVGGAAFWGVKLTADRFNNISNRKDIQADVIIENEEEKTDDNTEEGITKNTATIPSSNETSSIVQYDVADVAEKVMPSIVSITGTYVTTYDYWFNSYESETPGAGSGIIIGKDDDYLYVVTNYHVVEDAKELSVSFIDDETADAIVKGYDEQYDIAIVLVKINDIAESTLEQIKEIQVGSSDVLRAGDPCIAIGNALGYGQSVTVGYISALERELSVSDGMVKVLQTDAAINPGNSGGALVNLNGELIGINTAKYVDSKVEGTGYALPISDIQGIINDLIESDDNTPSDTKSGEAFLGISAQTITEEYSELLGMPKGIYISSVEQGSAAEECGIVSGDVIFSFDGKEVSDMNELHELVVAHKPGDEVEIEFYRNNNGDYKEMKVTAKLKAKK